MPSVENTDFEFFADLPPSLTNLDIGSLKTIRHIDLEVILKITRLKAITVARDAVHSIKLVLLLSMVPSLKLETSDSGYITLRKLAHLRQIMLNARSGALKGKFAVPIDFERYPVQIDLDWFDL